MKTLLRDIPDGPQAIGPYSPGVLAEGRFVFVSGMVPFNPATGKIERGSVAEQTGIVISNIEKVLAAAGASLSDVVSSRVYLSNLTPETFAEMNGVYAPRFGASAPARATIGVQLLGFDVEIECIACLPATQRT
jgi:2-iminobutanoate/2-iminopropanoate deaminase